MFCEITDIAIAWKKREIVTEEVLSEEVLPEEVTSHAKEEEDKRKKEEGKNTYYEQSLENAKKYYFMKCGW
jgi:hypothetical protein